MIAVGMVQVSVHQVVRVVTVGDRLMTAAGSVLVPLVVRAAIVGRRAAARVGGAYRQRVLIHVVPVDVVQMAVVQVVRVPVMLDGGMAAARAVLMGVVRVGFTVAHRYPSGHLTMPVVVALPGMLQHAEDQVDHVLVRESVVDMLSLTTGHHEVFLAEHPQLL